MFFNYCWMTPFLLLYCLNIIIFLRFARIWRDFFAELVTTPPMWWRRDPLPKTPLRKPPLHYTCPSVPKRRGAIACANFRPNFRLKFQGPFNPKNPKKNSPNNINPFSTKSIKNFSNKIPRQFSHILSRQFPYIQKRIFQIDQKTLFSLGGGGLFPIGYLREKFFRKIFLLRDFQPLSGHKKKKTGVYPSLL